eukprot:1161661-Pelagomonas_calceolata.AAC.11
MGGKKGARAAALKRDLLKAAYAGDIAAVNRCLAPDYSNINFAREDGATALHMACSSGSVECVHHLLRAGADHKKKDSRGLTPLYDACLTKSDTHIKCVEILLHAGASARIATKVGAHSCIQSQYDGDFWLDPNSVNWIKLESACRLGAH